MSRGGGGSHLLDVDSSYLPPQLRQFSDVSSPALALRIHFNQEVAHGLSQAPCTLQLAATALPLLTGAVPVLHVQLPPGRLQRHRGSEQTLTMSQCHCS